MLTRQRRRSPLTLRELRKLVQLHHQEYTQRDIAEKLRCSHQAVLVWLRKLGLRANGFRTTRSRLKRSESRKSVHRLRKLRLARAALVIDDKAALAVADAPARHGWLGARYAHPV